MSEGQPRLPQPESYQLRPYGPSNYEERPEQTTTIIEKAPTPNNKGEKAFANIDAMTAMQQQAETALNNGEKSPDALWGIWDKLSANAGKISNNDPEMKDWLSFHRNLIQEGINRYGTISPEIVRKFVTEGKSHPRLLAESPEQTAQTKLGNVNSYYEFQADDSLSKSSDTWDTVGYMLRLTAEYEDGKARGKY